MDEETTVRVGFSKRQHDGAVRVEVTFKRPEGATQYALNVDGARQLRDALDTMLGMIERGDDEVISPN
jgi:hypothetical protein